MNEDDPSNYFQLMDECLRNWTEDKPHENGNYQNKCYSCGKLFIGHKRRVICKKCAIERGF